VLFKIKVAVFSVCELPPLDDVGLKSHRGMGFRQHDGVSRAIRAITNGRNYSHLS